MPLGSTGFKEVTGSASEIETGALQGLWEPVQFWIGTGVQFGKRDLFQSYTATLLTNAKADKYHWQSTIFLQEDVFTGSVELFTHT